MGLDISAYSQAEWLGGRKPETSNDWDYVYNEDLIWVQCWGPYEAQFEGLTEGLYKVNGTSTGFRAGSYSGYNIWREQLSKAILGVDPLVVWNNLDNFKGAPFVELINFSDCEGYIGPIVSTKLLADFKQHWTDFSALADTYSGAKYNDWLEGFELAADNGFVEFH